MSFWRKKIMKKFNTTLLRMVKAWLSISGTEWRSIKKHCIIIEETLSFLKRNLQCERPKPKKITMHWSEIQIDDVDRDPASRKSIRTFFNDHFHNQVYTIQLHVPLCGNYLAFCFPPELIQLGWMDRWEKSSLWTKNKTQRKKKLFFPSKMIHSLILILEKIVNNKLEKFMIIND